MPTVAEVLGAPLIVGTVLMTEEVELDELELVELELELDKLLDELELLELEELRLELALEVEVELETELEELEDLAAITLMLNGLSERQVLPSLTLMVMF